MQRERRAALAIAPEQEASFRILAEREWCPFPIVGTASHSDKFIVTDRLMKQDVIRLNMSTLFGEPPRMHRTDKHVAVPSSLAPMEASELPVFPRVLVGQNNSFDSESECNVLPSPQSS